MEVDNIDQGLTNYGPWAKSSLITVFVIKVLLENSFYASLIVAFML